jgi:hypothetical protein
MSYMAHVLKDKGGNKIGEIKTRGSKQVLYDRHGSKLGEYDENTDITHDKHGRRVGTGNLLSSLLVDA